MSILSVGACGSKVPGTICWPYGRTEGCVSTGLDPAQRGAFCAPRPFPGPSWKGPAHPAITWPDDGFQQGDPSGQELQLSLLLQEAL